MMPGLVFSITRKNADAGASFFVSQNWNPVGFSGVYNPSEITVAYDIIAARWMVKNISGTPVPVGGGI